MQGTELSPLAVALPGGLSKSVAFPVFHFPPCTILYGFIADSRTMSQLKQSLPQELWFFFFSLLTPPHTWITPEKKAEETMEDLGRH